MESESNDSSGGPHSRKADTTTTTITPPPTGTDGSNPAREALPPSPASSPPPPPPSSSSPATAVQGNTEAAGRYLFVSSPTLSLSHASAKAYAATVRQLLQQIEVHLSPQQQCKEKKKKNYGEAGSHADEVESDGGHCQRSRHPRDDSSSTAFLPMGDEHCGRDVTTRPSLHAPCPAVAEVSEDRRDATMRTLRRLDWMARWTQRLLAAYPVDIVDGDDDAAVDGMPSPTCSRGTVQTTRETREQDGVCGGVCIADTQVEDTAAQGAVDGERTLMSTQPPSPEKKDANVSVVSDSAASDVLFAVQTESNRTALTVPVAEKAVPVHAVASDTCVGATPSSMIAFSTEAAPAIEGDVRHAESSTMKYQLAAAFRQECSGTAEVAVDGTVEAGQEGEGANSPDTHPAEAVESALTTAPSLLDCQPLLAAQLAITAAVHDGDSGDQTIKEKDARCGEVDEAEGLVAASHATTKSSAATTVTAAITGAGVPHGASSRSFYTASPPPIVPRDRPPLCRTVGPAFDAPRSAAAQRAVLQAQGGCCVRCGVQLAAPPLGFGEWCRSAGGSVAVALRRTVCRCCGCCTRDNDSDESDGRAFIAHDSGRDESVDSVARHQTDVPASTADSRSPPRRTVPDPPSRRASDSLAADRARSDSRAYAGDHAPRLPRSWRTTPRERKRSAADERNAAAREGIKGRSGTRVTDNESGTVANDDVDDDDDGDEDGDGGDRFTSERDGLLASQRTTPVVARRLKLSSSLSNAAPITASPQAPPPAAAAAAGRGRSLFSPTLFTTNTTTAAAPPRATEVLLPAPPVVSGDDAALSDLPGANFCVFEGRYLCCRCFSTAARTPAAVAHDTDRVIGPEEWQQRDASRQHHMLHNNNNNSSVNHSFYSYDYEYEDDSDGDTSSLRRSVTQAADRVHRWWVIRQLAAQAPSPPPADHQHHYHHHHPRREQQHEASRHTPSPSDPRRYCVLPAHVLLRWDFTRYPVSARAAAQLARLSAPQQQQQQPSRRAHSGRRTSDALRVEDGVDAASSVSPSFQGAANVQRRSSSSSLALPPPPPPPHLAISNTAPPTLYDISVLNPELYTRVPALAAALRLRKALCLLHSQAWWCPHYRTEVWGVDRASCPPTRRTSTLHESYNRASLARRTSQLASQREVREERDAGGAHSRAPTTEGVAAASSSTSLSFRLGGVREEQAGEGGEQRTADGGSGAYERAGSSHLDADAKQRQHHALQQQLQLSATPPPPQCAPRRRYLVERAEGWSLQDLCRLVSGHQESTSTAAARAARGGIKQKRENDAPLLIAELQVMLQVMRDHVEGCECCQLHCVAGSGQATALFPMN